MTMLIALDQKQMYKEESLLVCRVEASLAL